MEPLLFTRSSNIYANDLVLPSHTRDQVQKKMSNLEQQASSIALSFNAKNKSISKQQNDTTTYRDQQSSTRVRQQGHLPEQHHQFPRRCRRRHQITIGKSQVSICKPAAALEILSILPKDQTQNLPEQCPLRAPLRLRVLVQVTTRHQWTFQLPQHLPKEDTERVLALDHLQHQTPPSNKTTTHLPENENVGIA